MYNKLVRLVNIAASVYNLCSGAVIDFKSLTGSSKVLVYLGAVRGLRGN